MKDEEEHKNYKNIYKSLPIKVKKLKMDFCSRLKREAKMFDCYSTNVTKEGAENESKINT